MNQANMDPIEYLPLHYRSLPASDDYNSFLTDEESTNPSWSNVNCTSDYISKSCSYEKTAIPVWTAYLSLVSSLASMVGSTLIILSFVLWRDLRTVARAILVFLAMADLLTAVGYFFGGVVYLHYEVYRNGSLDDTFQRLCTAQSFLTTVFPISSFLWTAHLAIYLFVAIVLRKVQVARKMILFFHITAWGIPLAICIPAVATGILGSAESRSSASWCWIRLDTNIVNMTRAEVEKTLAKFYGFEFLCGKIWEILTCIISIVLCVTVKAVLTTRKKQAGMTESIKYGYVSAEKKMQEVFLQLDHKLIWIPIVFILLRFWGTFRFFISLAPSCRIIDECDWICIDHNCHNLLYNTGLIMMQSICDPGQGWSNALLYVVFHRKIAQRLCPCIFVCGARVELFFRKYCCLSWCKHSQSSGDTPGDKDPLVLNDSSRSTSRNPSRHDSLSGYKSNEDGSLYASLSGSFSGSLVYTPRVITPETASINES